MPAPSANWTRRIVLLHHAISPSSPSQTGRKDHFDLMIEPDDSNELWTWACSQNPFVPEIQGHQLPADRLPDHRRVYLDYEGPVSQDRGHVRQVAGGYYQGQLNSNALSLTVKLTPAVELIPAEEQNAGSQKQSLITGSLELSLSQDTAWNIIFNSTIGQ